MENEPIREEESLDPDDWDAMRRLGHRMVDDMLDYLQTVRDRPVWTLPPEDVRQHLTRPLPLEPEAPERVYREFFEKILPYPMGNIHPRFWGWVMGSGTVTGVLAEMLAATMNPNLGGGNHVGVLVEKQVLNWCKEIMGFPAESSGLLVSGGSMANLIGLAVARHTHAGYDVRRDGVRAAGKPLTIYGSVEMHSSIQKAVELMGLGSAALRKIPVDSQYRIRLPDLVETIHADRQAGSRPICVVGNAGTVNTGAIDDLEALASLCRAEQIWFHVDGAFGALVRLSPSMAPLVKGLEQADSVIFDLHKWMYLPFEAGCVLIRHESDHRETFAVSPAYLAHAGERGLASGATWLSEYGLQLSRNFRALKVWMSLKEHGALKFGRLIDQNVAQARYLAEIVETEPELELIAPVPLNIVCFRYNPGGLPDEELNLLNQELLIRLHESGQAVPTYTTLNGQYAIRAAITNHRSRREDFNLLTEVVLRLGRELAREQQRS